ncbi:MAG TPA: biotin synthase BioB [Cyanobacteria bacterium UBA11159]|nr:biotin synthase BioB [Cyanobacteria bacterium UBA11367]HBE60322.1 biotin synthase BioB [Cyanobacteria bacterium UBA11366]HBR72638.1 biotin synthase BioB [Cyanobacteria bacterium UBA11159]HBS68757.1 biotin synthase BioB [Cyanobacteria bacterium UBA11153]HCA98138.1 biotin synthase BioB [Cyanobacteria bacterium UBA9226]
MIASSLLQLPDWNKLAHQSLAGELLTREEARGVLSAPDDILLDQLAAAYRVRRHYWGNRVRLHFLLNAQSGLCPEDCHYCSQSKISSADIEKYPLLATEKILAAAQRAAELKAGTFCFVISGRSPNEAIFSKVIDAVSQIKANYDLKICACLGLLSEEQTHRLAAAGVDRVNHNLNTSEGHHSEICTTHNFCDRVTTVNNVKAAGITTCSGGILGMGESDDDVIDLALSLRELEVTSVPVNFLIPIPGTPLGEIQELNPRRCLRILCLFRFILPSQEIRIAGGREVHLRCLQPLGLYPANSIFVGDYLTTPGQAAHQDWDMIRDAGFVLESADGSILERFEGYF